MLAHWLFLLDGAKLPILQAIAVFMMLSACWFQVQMWSWNGYPKENPCGVKYQHFCRNDFKDDDCCSFVALILVVAVVSASGVTQINLCEYTIICISQEDALIEMGFLGPWNGDPWGGSGWCVVSQCSCIVIQFSTAQRSSRIFIENYFNGNGSWEDSFLLLLHLPQEG